MAAIRNACVARGTQASSTFTYVYTVPAGFVLLLKSVYLRAGSGTPSVVDIYAFASGGGTNVLVAQLNSAGNDGPSWQGWLALNAGDQIGLLTGASAMNYWISGAVLPYVVVG